MRMRVNVGGLLEQAAIALDKANDGGRAFSLRELGEHLALVGLQPGVWPEFAELYCLKREDIIAAADREKAA